MYKVIVTGGLDSIPLSFEEALEYAFDSNCECKIVDLETGESVETEEE